MQRLTRSSQPGFMDARRRLVSRDVILPTQRGPDPLDVEVVTTIFFIDLSADYFHYS